MFDAQSPVSDPQQQLDLLALQMFHWASKYNLLDGRVVRTSLGDFRFNDALVRPNGKRALAVVPSDAEEKPKQPRRLKPRRITGQHPRGRKPCRIDYGAGRPSMGFPHMAALRRFLAKNYPSQAANCAREEAEAAKGKRYDARWPLERDMPELEKHGIHITLT